jgi:hypothetical protein
MISGVAVDDVLSRRGFTEDFRLIVLSTTSCSFDKLTIRVDIFRTIVPALCNVDPAAALGLRLRRIELDRLIPSLRLLLPASACPRSSPSRDIPVGVTFENLTLLVLLALFPVGVDCALAPAIGAR